MAAAPEPVVVALHIAAGRRLPMRSVDRVLVEAGRGIVGDRYHGSRHRHVTVQSAAELALAERAHGAPIAPGLTRRNLTLSTGTLERAPGHRLRIGRVLLEVVRDAAPCKLLEDALGRDARLALSRRAGVVCRVLEGGEIRLGDRAEIGVALAPSSSSAASSPSRGSRQPRGLRLRAADPCPSTARNVPESRR